jgi:hypothetical protein
MKKMILYFPTYLPLLSQVLVLHFQQISGVLQFSIRSVWNKTFFGASSIIVAVPYSGGKYKLQLLFFDN